MEEEDREEDESGMTFFLFVFLLGIIISLDMEDDEEDDSRIVLFVFFEEDEVKDDIEEEGEGETNLSFTLFFISIVSFSSSTIFGASLAFKGCTSITLTSSSVYGSHIIPVSMEGGKNRLIKRGSF
jgi:hypothetical protein